MRQALAEDDGLTANQRRDREWLAEFRRRETAILELEAEIGNRRQTRLARQDNVLLAQRAPHLFGIDQHGVPFVRETQ